MTDIEFSENDFHDIETPEEDQGDFDPRGQDVIEYMERRFGPFDYSKKTTMKEAQRMANSLEKPFVVYHTPVLGDDGYDFIEQEIFENWDKSPTKDITIIEPSL